MRWCKVESFGSLPRPFANTRTVVCNFMKKNILILFLILAFSCSSTEEFNINDRANDINEIIETIATSEGDLKDIKVISSIKKLKILFDKKDFFDKDLNVFIYDSQNEIPYPVLISPENEIKLFDSKDYKYLKSLNNIPDSIILDKNYFKDIDFISVAELKSLSKKENSVKYGLIEFTIPIFTRKNDLAYVLEAYYCGPMCGSGTAYILKKIDGSWKIIDSWQTWIS